MLNKDSIGRGLIVVLRPLWLPMAVVMLSYLAAKAAVDLFLEWGNE